MSLLYFVLRLGTAFLCGTLIGLERQYRQRTAGLRTSALVASGSALFVLVAVFTPNDSNPTTIDAQVVSGVGFLCAGVIIRDGMSIRGLNTAGTLWCASGVGVLAGSGYYLPAFIGSVVVLIANLFLRPVARAINKHSKETGQAKEVPVHYTIRVICVSQEENHIRLLLLQHVSSSELTLQALASQDTSDLTKIEVHADLKAEERKDALLEQVVARLSLERSVSSVRWEVVAEGGDVAPTLFTARASELEAATEV